MIIVYNLTQYKFPQSQIDRLHKKLFLHFRIVPDHILELILVNKSLIKKINYQYLQHNESTDVLSFPVDNTHLKNNKIGAIFGSIYLCPDFIKIQDQGVVDYKPYIIHGFIHLLGYNHYSQKEKKQWSQILKKITNFTTL